MKSIFLSYIFCAFGLFSPFAGLHRFYLGRPISGLFYFFTWGFFGLGTIFDLIRMPFLVDEINMRMLLNQELYNKYFAKKTPKLRSPDRDILKCAHQNHGTVTMQMVSLESGLSLKEAQQELNRLYREGFCTKDIDTNGNEIFKFSGLKAEKPLI